MRLAIYNLLTFVLVAFALATHAQTITINTDVDQIYVSDSFDAGSPDLIGSGSGTGWSGNWLLNQTGTIRVDTDNSLSFPKASSFSSTGGHIYTVAAQTGYSNKRSLTNGIKLGANTTFYVSFLAQKSESGNFRIEGQRSDGVTRYGVGVETDGKLKVNAAGQIVTSEQSFFENDKTYLVVARWDYVGGQADLKMILFEEGEVIPVSDEGLVWDHTDGEAEGKTGVVLEQFNFAFTAGAVMIDEFKLGSTWNSVTSLKPFQIDVAQSGSGTIDAEIGTNFFIEGESKTFNFTPDGGHALSDVVVDGTSVGAVNSYTFSDIQANHTLSVAFNEIPNLKVLYPTADSYVKGGSNANSNYGDDASLAVKTDVDNVSNTRQALFRFSLPEISTTVISAKLRVKLSSINGASTSHGVKFISDDSWDESTVTWNTKPSESDLLDTESNLVADNWIEFDVTAQVENERKGDRKISLSLVETGTVKRLANYFSKEADLENRPELIITTSNGIIAEADTYIRDGAPTTNYGSEPEMVVKIDASSNSFNRESILRFDVENYPNTVNSAILKVKLKTLNGASTTNNIKFVSDDSWDESTITWANKPTAGAVLASQTVKTEGWVEFDVTNQVETERLGDGKISFIISDPSTTKLLATYHTKEATSSEDRPQLIINAVNRWNGSWSKGTEPVATDNIIINADYTGAGFVCNDLTVETGQTVDIGSGTLDIKGDLTNEGTLIIKSGASLLTYEGTSFTGNGVRIERNTRYSNGQYSFVGSVVKKNSAIKGNTLGRAVYRYDETVAYGDDEGLKRWVKSSKDILEPGVGYTQAYKKMLIFNGEPNNGTVTVTGTYTDDIDNGSEGWNLVANPYPSAINLFKFLNTNIPVNNGNTTGSVYLWDDNGSNIERGTNDDYIVMNGVGVSGDSRRGQAMGGNGNKDRLKFNGDQIMLGAGQGFFVQLIDNSKTNITFTEAMREGGMNADENFFRKAVDTKQVIRLALKSEDEVLYSETLLGFLDKATEGIDPMYDAKKLTAGGLKLYSLIGEKAFTIQGLPTIAGERMIALGMDAEEAGAYTLDISEIENITDNTVVELIDTKLNIVHNLSESAYTFETEETVEDTRFVLNLRQHIISSLEGDLARELIVETYPTGLKMFGSNAYDISIMDFTGKVLLNQKLTNTAHLAYNFSKNKLYIIKVNNVVKKVLFH